MQAKCNARELYNALKLALSVRNAGKRTRSNYLPQWAVLVNLRTLPNGNSGGELVIQSTDLCGWCITRVPCAEVGGDFSIAVDPDSLLEFLKASKNAEVSIVADSSTRAVVSAGGRSLQLATVGADEMAAYTPLENVTTVGLLTHDQINLAMQLLPQSMGDRKDGRNLHRFCIRSNGGNLELCSTDGHRLTLITARDAARVEIDASIDGQYMPALKQAVSEHSGPVTILTGERQNGREQRQWVCLDFGGKTLLEFMAGSFAFPNYHNVLDNIRPLLPNVSFTASAGELLSALKGSVSAARVAKNNINETRLCIDGDKLDVTFSGSDSVSFSEHVQVTEVDVSENTKLLVNASYLCDFFAKLGKSHHVAFKIYGPEQPIYLTVKELPGVEYVVMPIRGRE